MKPSSFLHWKSSKSWKKMALVDTNWKTFLSLDSSLPPDVIFLVKGDEVEKRIAAHRFLLAGTSPVFDRQFYGPMKDIREVVEVKDTTSEAFMTMMNFIYKAPGEETFNLNDIDCPQKLFEVLELAERYEIANLKKIAMSGDHCDKPYEERTWSEGSAKEK